eukprot:3968948-Pleurochrysis_carterae.AAC.1
MVGRRIEVLWMAERKWKRGVVTHYNPANGKHTIEYLGSGTCARGLYVPRNSSHPEVTCTLLAHALRKAISRQSRLRLRFVLFSLIAGRSSMHDGKLASCCFAIC